MTIILKPENVAQLVFFIRGEKVLLDADLAMLYGVEPRALNQAVARNRKRFPADFMFQLSAREYDALTSQIVISDKDDARGASALRSQIVISKKGRGGTPLPSVHLYRAGCRHALKCSAQRSGSGGEHRHHAHIRAVAPAHGHESRSRSQDPSARKEIRRAIRGGLRSDQATHYSAQPPRRRIGFHPS